MNRKTISFTFEELNQDIMFDKSPVDIANAEKVGFKIELAMGDIFYCETPKSKEWERQRNLLPEVKAHWVKYCQAQIDRAKHEKNDYALAHWLVEREKHVD